MDNCYIYHLFIENRKISKIISPNGKSNFENPVTQAGEKIYILTDSNTIIYVGKTKQPIRTRLRNGENPKHETGYHGYKWLELNSELLLFVFMINNTHSAEAIEAEIVYNVRRNENHWPKFQTEIHFFNVEDEQKVEAEKIYEYVREMILNR